MKAKYLIRKYTLYVGVAYLFVVIQLACTKFVEVDPPNNQLVSATVFDRNETAIAAIMSIYSKMVRDNNFTYNVAKYTGLASDELKNHSTELDNISIYSNSIISSDNGKTDNVWQFFYNVIYQANAVYEQCKVSVKISSDVKKQLMSEALFIRAWSYFYLVNLYGNVPLLTTTDYSYNSKAGNTDRTTIYNQIIADLTAAQNDLNENYTDKSVINATNGRFRPNKAVATAMLARVALFEGNYALAEQESTKLIAATNRYSLTPMDEIFLLNSKEAIWQLMMPTPAGNNGNSMEGQYFILTTKPTSFGESTTTVSDQLLLSFEPNDQRKNKWVGNFVDNTVTPNVTYPFPFKFKQKNSPAPIEYSTPLRLSEQFLIRAEARAMQNNIGGAQSDLNAIRSRAGLAGTSATDKEGLLVAILQERRIELFSEWGHRWLDLKRTGKIDEVMTIVAPSKGGAWKSYQQLWPIPLQSIQNDVNLNQNPGYN